MQGVAISCKFVLPDKNFQVHEPELYVPHIVELNKNMDYEKVYLYSMSVGV